MSTISVKVPVAAPVASAGRFLESYLATLPERKGSVRMTLRAGGLERSAMVTLRLARRPQDMAPRYGVHWEAEAGGPYPTFDGILSVEGGDDYDEFRLALHGTYQPPLGIVGQAFDTVLGKRIAEQTAR